MPSSFAALWSRTGSSMCCMRLGGRLPERTCTGTTSFAGHRLRDSRIRKGGSASSTGGRRSSAPCHSSAKAGGHSSISCRIPSRSAYQQIDRDASGGLLFPEETVSREHRNRYVVSSLVEEAITSSQLEGAATTRRVAKEMIRSGCAPLDKDERMILNTYHAMQWIRTRTKQTLTPEMVLGLHRLLGEGALDAGEPGVLRGPDPNDEFGVWSNGQRLYRPPDHAVATETSRTDLLALATRGFLARARQGRKCVFTAPSDLTA